MEEDMAARASQTAQIQGWIERLKAGDESARKELLACACARLERLTRKMLRSYPRVRRWEQTDDVFQNASLRLYRALAEVRPAGVVEFFRLAALNIRRELLDLAKHYYGPRGAGAHHASLAGGEESGEGPAACERADTQDDPARLAAWTEFHTQVDALPAEEREVFDLLWYQELTQAEAANLLGVSERTVKRRWQSARLQLFRALGGALPDA
jgi:RNA polymerase sigma-70 factor (ECF subfamily)